MRVPLFLPILTIILSINFSNCSSLIFPLMKYKQCLFLTQFITSIRVTLVRLIIESNLILWWYSLPVSTTKYYMTSLKVFYLAWEVRSLWRDAQERICLRLACGPLFGRVLSLNDRTCLEFRLLNCQKRKLIKFLYIVYNNIKNTMEKQEPKQVEKEQQLNKQKEGQLTCQLFLTRKKRMCKFPAINGSKYCAAHCSDLEDKVECPYEKGFFISAKKLQKHLKNCPKLVNRKKQETSQWYSKDINKAEEQMQQHAIEMPNLIQIPDDTMQKIVDKIIDLYCSHIQKEQWLHFIESNEKESLEDITNDHLQAKLITQKAYENKLIAPEFVYVEFGAGKGVLSYAIAVKIEEQFKKHSKNILLQRQSRRNKFDKFFKDNPYFQRYKGDVANFDFTVLPTTMARTAVQKCKLQTPIDEIQKQIGNLELIGVCKHMCGEALDISMRGLLQGNAKGCILASCCHHLCRYHTYLNPKFFQREGLTPEEIQILFRISSWGTMSHKFEPLSHNIFEDLKEKGYKFLEPDQKILVGRMTKRLIDLGRAEYLKGKLYKYCSDQLTPENYVIISRN